MGTPIALTSKQSTGITKDVFRNKVSLDRLRKIWNDEFVTYTDEEIIRIREWLYALSEVIIAVTNKREASTKLIPLNSTINETTESYSLCPGEHRRAG